MLLDGVDQEITYISFEEVGKFIKRVVLQCFMQGEQNIDGVKMGQRTTRLRLQVKIKY